MTETAGSVAWPPGTADVWWARRQDAADRHLALLDATERQRWAGYRHDADRERFLAGCALAKMVIAGCTGGRPGEVALDRTCRRCGQPHGKPAINGSRLELSVAHSGDLVAVAIAAAPVGVDVEQFEGRARPLGGDGDPDALARLVLADAERAALAAVPGPGRARAFLVAWTRKEAVTKATGDGLRAVFTGVVVAADHGGPRLVAWPYPQPPHSVTLHDLDPEPGYVAALAVIGRCDTVRARDGSALLAAGAEALS
jgi:4'-phosphopantetheinyl transferase